MDEIFNYAENKTCLQRIQKKQIAPNLDHCKIAKKYMPICEPPKNEICNKIVSVVASMLTGCKIKVISVQKIIWLKNSNLKKYFYQFIDNFYFVQFNNNCEKFRISKQIWDFWKRHKIS